MASIVLIHGINNQRFGPHTRKADWLPPLCDGIELAYGKGRWRLPDANDVEVAFWGDLFRPRAQTLSVGLPPFVPEDLEEEGEQELLKLLLTEAQRVGEVPPSSGDTLGAAPDWLHSAVYKLASSRFFRDLYGDGENVARWLIFGLKHVHRYMHDQRTYADVQGRVDETIRDDTTVVIGHSLGSVVAYEALCRAPRNVKTLITLGSPLGTPTLIYDRLRPVEGWRVSPAGARVRMQPAVEHWFNVWDKGDLVALVKDLRPLFAPELHQPDMSSIVVSNGRNTPHAIEKYLTEAAVGRAVCTGWA